MKLLDNIAVEARLDTRNVDTFAEAGLDTRVPHLEGETIFGFAKRKLDLPPGDDSDSYRHTG